VDYDGTQYWSDVISVIAHEETDVEMPLEQLALNVTNDPNPVRFDGKPPVFKHEGIKVASIGSLAGILSQTVIANTTPPKVYYYLNDHLGTPQLMTDKNNVVVWEAKYRPFGEAVVHPYSTVENNIRFPGQYFDGETGLHYNYHRYYEPRIGRYLRPDPIGLAGGINQFSYVLNNPINSIDFWGLWGFYCRIEWGDPYLGGDPLGLRYEEKEIGYYDAVFKRLLWQFTLAKLIKLSKLSKLPIPIHSPNFTYQLHITIYQKFKEYIQYYEVCYDDCTNEEISREYLGPLETGKTGEMILKEWKQTMKLAM